MDDALRIGLWNVLKIFVWDQAAYSSDSMYGGYYLSASANTELKNLCNRLWLNFFKRPLDTLENNWSKVHEELREYFFDASWHEVYDFVEFIGANYKRSGFRDKFADACNSILEREKAGYRLLNGDITPITAKEEVQEVEQALASPNGAVTTHLQRALQLLSDRESPDYRNSIKESISAVESLVVATVGERGTLGQLVKQLEDKIGLHPALRTAFSNLYGYTSDEGGIRHAILDASKVDFDEAKFFLIVCSAFVNFVHSKVGRAG